VTVHIESTYRDAVLQAYEYDAEGRLARIIARASEKGNRVVEDYGYDATGCKRRRTMLIWQSSARTIPLGASRAPTASIQRRAPPR